MITRRIVLKTQLLHADPSVVRDNLCFYFKWVRTFLFMYTVRGTRDKYCVQIIEVVQTLAVSISLSTSVRVMQHAISQDSVHLYNRYIVQLQLTCISLFLELYNLLSTVVLNTKFINRYKFNPVETACIVYFPVDLEASNLDKQTYIQHLRHFMSLVYLILYYSMHCCRNHATMQKAATGF